MESLLNKSNPELLELSESLANIDAEQAVLGALLVNNQAIIHITELRADHFYEGSHKRIFTAIFRNFDHGIKSDPVTLREMFNKDEDLADIGGAGYLAKLAAHAVTVFDIKSYADLIIDIAERRELLASLEGAIAWTKGDGMTEKAAELRIRFTAELEQGIGLRSADFQNDAEVTETILNDLKSDTKPYPTRYNKLDTAMMGGLYPGKSYGFAARKKTGKTILAGSISHNLNEKGVRHLFICGEMSPTEVHKRTLGRLLNVKSGAFYGKQSDNIGLQKGIAEIAVASKRNTIYKNAPGLTFEDLKRYVLLARMQKKITGFILDYWQLVGGKRKGQSTAEHLDEVAQWIADTCRKYDLWSIVMAQINQEGNTRGSEGIHLAFDQVYDLRAPDDDAGRAERWLDMSGTRYTPWRSVGSATNPGFYLNEYGPHFSETAEIGEDL